MSCENQIVANVRDFFQVGDPDWTNAFERAIYTYGADEGLDAIEIIVPAGDYILSRQIIPRRTITLRGAGKTATRIRFQNVATLNTTMQGAFAFGIETTLAAYTINPSGYAVRGNNITAGGADQSDVRDLSIIIQGTRPSGFDYGIWNSARLAVRNVLLYACGLRTTAGTLIIGSGSITGNANTSIYENVDSQLATEHAFVTDGTDSNNITFHRCSAFVPGVIGFYEGSQFGNKYDHCHREGAVAGTTNGYRSLNPGGTNRSLFLECYNEGDSVTTARWDIASGNAIFGYQGAMPEALGSGKNAWFGPGVLSGLTTTFQINCATDGDGYALGSASVAATRMATDGFYVRGGDGSLGSVVRGGDGVYLARNGTSILKFEKGSAISDVSGGATVDAEARAAINAILARLRAGTPAIAT